MLTALARSLMTLAARCLGADRREWAQAMEAEFDEAEAEQRLGFAIGCLIAACREMPRHTEGRLALADHALALGLLVPMAFLQFACAIGLGSGQGGRYGALAMTGAENPLLAQVQLGAVPSLLMLWVLLGAAHLCLAWALLDRDWTRVVQAGSLIAAAALTLVIMVQVLLLHAAFLGPVIGVLVLEMILVAAAFHVRGRVFPEAELAQTA
jgi:hypothetical protein